MQDLKAPLLVTADAPHRPKVQWLLLAALVVFLTLGAGMLALVYLHRQTALTTDALSHCRAELENDRIAKKLILEAVQGRYC